VPGTGSERKPTAAFAKNAPEPHFVCRHVYLKLVVEPTRCAITARLAAGALVPAWAAHAEGRLAAPPEHLDEIVAGQHLAFVYAHADGTVDDAAVPNGSALRCAGLVNRTGNVLAVMPHPERDGWNFNHLDRSEGDDILAPSGGAALFRSFVEAVCAA
jgi:phosphoribosylformylglycinamidine synthase